MRIVLTILAAILWCVQTSEAQSVISTAIFQKVDRGVAVPYKLAAHGYSARDLDAGLRRWYKERSYLPFWLEDDQPSSRAREVLDAIQNSEQDGLNPEDYFFSLIRARWSRSDLESLAELDLLLTLGAGHLAADAQVGRIEPRELDLKLFEYARVERPDLAMTLKEVVYRSDVGNAIQELFPHHRQYVRMKAALARYREIQKAGGWGVVPPGPPLVRGAHGARVLTLMRRLQVTEDYPLWQVVSEDYSVELEVAVKNFQNRHGLPTTGEVDEKTLQALNVPVERRIDAILVNLERWRWLDHDLSEGKQVHVNIAGFELFGLNQSKLVLRSPVIVGKTYHASPIFSDRIQYIEFNPYWNVPLSIASNEILPKMKKNPRYLEEQHMRLYENKSQRQMASSELDWKLLGKKEMNRYTVKQDPGHWNVLGSLKFVFPNKYSVYLHDTGSPQLFAQRDRALSHGCIRVSEPIELAAFLLDTDDDHWNAARVKALIANGKNQNVRLPKPIPIHLSYRTAWVDLDGSVNFRPDIYKRDALLAQVLKID